MLDVLGMIPGIGAMADLANGFWYLSEGDYFSAASSFVSAIPGVGDIAGGIAKGITGCTKISKAIKFATRFASNIGNFALGAYSTATQIYGLWDKYVIKGEPWGDESLGEFLGAAFTGVTTVLSGKGVVDDIANYKNTKHDILTSQCFVEGTLVVTSEGNKPIEEIQAGDLVYSTNPETGESEYKEVLRTFRKETDVLIHIFVNGEEIQTTPVHPFWVVDQWVAAKDLETGDVLTLADGTTATITKTYGEQLDEPVIVYNFEVSEFHTYYVTDTGVLVHNDSKCVTNNSNNSSNGSSEYLQRKSEHLTIEEALEKLENSGLKPGQTVISESRIREIAKSFDSRKASSSIFTDSTGRYIVEGHHTTVAATMLGAGTGFNMNIPTNQRPSATNIHWTKKWYEFWKKSIKVIE